MSDIAFKYWAIVRNVDGSEKGRVSGMTRKEVERKAVELAGEPVDFEWKG